MSFHSFGRKLGTAWHSLAAAARVVVGAPDYERYLAHLAASHPGRTPLPRADFLAERQRARYGRRMGRCC